MPITTNSYFSVRYNDNEVDKIGLSDTLDNYTAEEIKSHVLCGCRDKLLGGNLGLYDYGNGSYDVWNTGTPFATGTVDETYMHMLNGSGDNSTADLDGRYCGTVLLTDTSSAFPLCITPNNIANFKLITELNIKSYCMNISATLTQKGGIGATQLSDKTNTLYCVDIDLASLTYRYGTTLIEIAVNLAVVPYHVFEIAGELFLINGYKTNKLGFSCHLAPNRNGGMEIYPISSSADADSYSLAFNNLGFGDDYSDYSDDTYAWAYGFDTVNKFGSTDAELWYQCYFGILGLDVRYYYTSYNQMMMQFANTGLYFKIDGVIYKPLISDNVVYGYTDNLDTESDIDNWERDTKHDIPIAPPVPPPPSAPTGDVETDMPLAYIGGTAGMVSFIKINESGLASADDIAESISRFDITTIGKDLLRNFVAFKCYAVLNIDDSVVRDIKVAGHTLKDGADNALQGEYIGGIAPVDFTAGTVKHLYNDFRDYAPYTRIQMYVPFCGWFDLPSWCMGKEITGTMFTDLYNGTVKAVIYASRTVVAEVGGCCAFDIPFAAESTGMKAGAVISSALSTIAMTGATIAAPNIATGIAAVSSAANLVSAANSSGTALKGVMGDGSNTNGLLHVYIKTTRPTAPNGKKDIPEQYKQDFGIPCFKQLTLTEGDGFTQIMDANITGSMTDREKQMIIDGFRHGLIL